MKICVVALGKIGLPLAVQFASKGHTVLGADVSEPTVRSVNDGVVPFPGEADLDVKLKEAVNAGLLKATPDTARGLRPGTLVSYETTLPVGTTRNRWAPLLEEGSGLVAGRDFHLVFSPERVLTGRVFADLRKYPKL